MFLLNLLPVFITVFGFYFLLKLRFFYIIRPRMLLPRLRNILKDKSSRRALALALAGTLGVGNIVGVAFGISVGGAGSLFWILISALFASVIKYAESSLGSLYRSEAGGGMSFVIRSTLGRAGIPISYAYALLCIGLSFAMGGALQSKSAVEAAAFSTGINPSLFALIFSVLVLVVIIRGANFIESFTAFVIPLATIVYIFLCFGIIFVNFNNIPKVLAEVLKSAVGIRSAAGGILGFTFSHTIREGFARGLLSNEAGAGTSAMAESRADVNPADVGLLGVFEVFFDTVILCPLTGFAVLLSMPDPSEFSSGMEIVSRAVFSVFGGFGASVLFILISLFAYSTVVCWYFYGMQSVRFIFGRKKSGLYTALFIYFVFVGFIIPSAFLISVSDYLLLIMTILTLLTLIKSSERILRLSEQYGLLKKSDMRKGRNSIGKKQGKL